MLCTYYVYQRQRLVSPASGTAHWMLRGRHNAWIFSYHVHVFMCQQGESYSDYMHLLAYSTHTTKYVSHTFRLLYGELFTARTTLPALFIEHGTARWKHRSLLSRQFMCKSPFVLRMWDVRSIFWRSVHQIVRSQIFPIGSVVIKVAEEAKYNNNNHLGRSWLLNPVAMDIRNNSKEGVIHGITLYVTLWY